MTIVTRFAPSPTGYLHIGNARTALFNFFLARHYGGKFLLRVEDTDRKRHNEDAVRVIYEGLKWMGLSWDDKPVSQFERRDRHAEVAKEMLAKGNAYHCYLSPDELNELRDEARANNTRFESPWRDRDPSEAPKGIDPVIRLKAPKEGSTTVHDLVQGEVTVDHKQLDDLILLRSDGTPTYMLSVVVDDHDMGVTHIVRGDDHFTNTFRQAQIYAAMGWELPKTAHLPMILGDDGAKLSKRHGALGIHEYEQMGYLPEALCNYLMRLGWSHGDDEIISMKQAVEWFDFDGLNKSASRFDFTKLNNINAHYIKEKKAEKLVEVLIPFLEKETGLSINEKQTEVLIKAMPDLKDRANTLVDLAKAAAFYIQPRPISIASKAAKALDEDGRKVITNLIDVFKQAPDFNSDALDEKIQAFLNDNDLKYKHIGMPLRAALTGTTSSPSLHHVAAALGRKETIDRLNDAVMQQNQILTD